MTVCDHVRPALGAYALGALDVDEAAEVRRHLASCAQCAAEYDALAPLPGLLSVAGGAEAAAEEPLSPAFEERLLDAFARDRSEPPRRARSRLRPRLRPRWLAVGLAAAAAMVAGIVVAAGDDEGPSRRYDVAFHGVGTGVGASARANLESREDGTTLHLWVKGLPSDKEAVYEVLCDAEHWTASAGTFRTDADGRAYVILTTALRRGEYDAIRIVRRGHKADGRLVRRAVLAARLS
jgi:predicted anti-sigma-YlaC factor YlaD